MDIEKEVAIIITIRKNIAINKAIGFVSIMEKAFNTVFKILGAILDRIVIISVGNKTIEIAIMRLFSAPN